MRRLILLRHSNAERAVPGRSDADRKLSPQGSDDAAMIGAYLANHSLRPDLVRRDRIVDFPSRGAEIARTYKVLRTGRPAALAWKAGDLNPAGAIGNARFGTAEAGHALLDHGARVFVDLLRDVAGFGGPAA